MAATMLPSVNSAVFSFIAEALENANVKNRIETYIHEFEDCQHYLCRSKADPDFCSLSFKHSSPFTHTARLALIDAYEGFATLLEQPEPEFQVTVQVSQEAVLFCPYNSQVCLDAESPHTPAGLSTSAA